jgi:uncharacterized membrane protein YdcZ (DUF606 family)
MNRAKPGSGRAFDGQKTRACGSSIFRKTPALSKNWTLIAFYVLSITFIAPKFGVGNAVFCVLLGQLVSAAAIDHFALFGAAQNSLNLVRSSGIAVMALGVWITQQA